MIGAAAFHRHMKNPETEVYWASLQCIEEAIQERKYPAPVSGLPEFCRVHVEHVLYPLQRCCALNNIESARVPKPGR